MTSVTTSAPGKVVLSGEYAVLDGAAAIGMAVNRRARVCVSRNDEEHHSVTALGLATTTGRFTVTDGQFEWLDDGEYFELLESVWRVLGATVSGGLVLSLDTREFVDASSGKKIGIGSSAALVTALTAAINDVADGDADLKQVAMTAHRDFQSGAGSGVDVVCSLRGGVVEYRMCGDEPTALNWPAGLAYAMLWSGVPASTSARLNKLEQQAAKKSRTALAAAAERVAINWRRGETAAILEELQTYVQALRAFSVDHNLGIFDAGHAQLVDAAASAGVVYKPCGAGGGDIGIVLSNDESAVASFVTIAAAHNFEYLDLSLDTRGVQRHREEN